MTVTGGVKKSENFADVTYGSALRLTTYYRKAHLQANLGWVDFDFGCSTLCLVLPGLIGNWQNWLSSWATSQIKVNTTKVRQEMGHPVLIFIR